MRILLIWLLAFPAFANDFTRATIKSVYDGDTVTADLHIPTQFGVVITMPNQKLRLYGIDTPEVTGFDKVIGLAVRDYLRSRIDGESVNIEPILDSRGNARKGKYGRWLVIIWDKDGNINDDLVSRGYARTVDW